MSTSPQLLYGDCLELMRQLPDSSVDLIIADPPYFRVKGDWWDNQWEDAGKFLDWIKSLCLEWQRLLKPNGSLYLFASPRMAARVEVVVGQCFNVLNRITWRKESTKAKMQVKEEMRAFWPASEAIVFAEHFGADNRAKGASGYGLACDKLRGSVFDPIRLYLLGEFRRAGVKTERANSYCGTRSMAHRHYFTQSQWGLPTEAHYTSLRNGLNAEGRRPAPPFEKFHPTPRPWFAAHTHARYLPVEYESLRVEYESLRVEYESLRVEYESFRVEYEQLRRPFILSAHIPYTDVWDFSVVKPYPTKHPCEKPLALLEHMISVSSREGALVLDPCMGSGTTGVAAILMGRRFIGMDVDPYWYAIAVRRLARIQTTLPQEG